MQSIKINIVMQTMTQQMFSSVYFSMRPKSSVAANVYSPFMFTDESDKVWWEIIGDVVGYYWRRGGILLEMWWNIIGDVVEYYWRCGGIL